VLYRLLRATVPPLLRVAWRLRVEGIDRLPQGAAIVVANHDSLADPFVVGSAIDRPLRYLAKAELWENRAVRRLMDTLGAIKVERGRGDVAAVAAAAQAIAAGDSVVFFPQGTVLGSPDRPWQRGAARIALATGAPLVPVAIVGAADGLRPRAWLPRRAHVRVVIGEPIRVPISPVTIPAARELTGQVRAAVECLARGSD
jgi:1-acyl-sn-glycerol-3-phosphate acyltransferase